MNLLQEYTAKEQMLKQLQEEIGELEKNPDLQKGLEFKDKLLALMDEYGKTAKDVLQLLNPHGEQAVGPGTQSTRKRKPRKTKVFKNPHTGEVIETKGANHKILKQWKDQYGDEVSSWLVEEKD